MIISRFIYTKKTMTIQLAEHDEIDAFEKQVDQILSVLGHPEALVTDLSDIGDFMSFGRAKPETMEVLAQLMGHEVSINDLLVTLARELWDKEQHNRSIH